MNKKTIIGIIFAVIIITIVGGVYFFSGNNSNQNNESQKINDPNVDLGDEQDIENTDETVTEENSTSEESQNETDNNNNTNEGKKTLVAYFSVPETDNPNNMTSDEDNSTVVINGEVLGNTQYVAMLISEKTNADLFRIEPTNAYPTDHQELLSRAMEEMESDARPEIKDEVENFDDYDVIYIGYPIWNADLPPIINTFLEKYNFDGKTVVPFCTHGGSVLSGTPNTIARKLSNATVITNGFSISRSSMNNAETEVTNWLREIYN